jgi:hypothetical protein
MASATPIFAGQWNLYSDPYWIPTKVLTGQEAAALLFGGSASDYLISTVGSERCRHQRHGLVRHLRLQQKLGQYAQDYNTTATATASTTAGRQLGWTIPTPAASPIPT